MMNRLSACREMLRVLLFGCFALPISAIPFAASGQASDRTWYVDGAHGNNHNDCKSPQEACRTIRHAIKLTAPGDSIIIAAAIYPENLTMPHSLNLIGSGSATTIIDGEGIGSVILNGRPGVTVSNVTMRNGGGDYGGGIGDGGNIYNCGYPHKASLTITDSVIVGGSVRSGHGNDGYGGAIYNCADSTVTIVNTTISGNRAEVGGAICNGGKLTVRNSTFSDNTVREDKAGAIANYGLVIVDNSTFSRNSSRSTGHGGAIHNGGILYHAPGRLIVSNSTFSGNEAAGGGGIFNVRGSTVVLQNSIIADNTGGNCRGALTSQGYNLSSDKSCNFGGSGDLNDTDPDLGRLKNNGGPTETMALLHGSPAIDSGNPNGCTDGRGHLLRTDQRGKPRPDKEDSGGCDRGAFERQSD